MRQEGMAYSVAFSPDGSTLVSGGGTNTGTGFLNIWDSKTGKRIGEAGLDGAVKALRFLPDGETLAAGTHDQIIILLDPKTGQHLTTLITAILGARSVTVSPDGSVIAAACTPTVMR